MIMFISAISADIIPKWNHISTKSADITKLADIEIEEEIFR